MIENVIGKADNQVMTNQEKALKVIELIEAGSSENAACEKVGINRATFRSAALKARAGDEYARGLTALANAQAEALEKTIDDMRAGVIDAQMARVEIDARKWFASKFLPKQYGDKITQEHTGADGGPIQSQTTVDVTGLTPEQLQALASIPVK